MPILFPGSNQDGYTLTELLVVLVIGVMLVTASSSLFFGNAATGLKQQSIAVASSLRTLRMTAVTEGMTQQVLFSEENIADRLQVERGNDLVFGFEPTFASGSSDDEVPLIFYPDGSASGGILQVGLEEDNRQIDINWLTGAVRIVD